MRAELDLDQTKDEWIGLKIGETTLLFSIPVLAGLVQSGGSVKEFIEIELRNAVEHAHEW